MKAKKIDAWATFLRSYNRLHQKMEGEMKAAGHPCLEVYDVLWTLEQAPEHCLRFSDLGEKVFMAKHNISRLSDRLESQGLIERKRCPDDRRGVWAVLTPAGKQLRLSMWQTYRLLIDTHFSVHLTQVEHAEMIRLLTKVWKEE